MKKIDRLMQIESSDVLLDIGVSIPIFRILFTNKWVRMKMRRPTLGALIRIAKLYLQMGVSVSEISKLSPDEQLELIANHGDKIVRIVAVAILRDRFRLFLFGAILRHILKWYVSDAMLTGINREFAPLFGSSAFLNITISAEAVNPLAPRLGQSAKRG